MGAQEGGDGGPREGEGGEERRSKSGLNRGRMVFLLTSRGRGGRGRAAAGDYLAMEEVGEWEPDTCGGVLREGVEPARNGVAICCSHRRWRRKGAFNPVQKC